MYAKNIWNGITEEKKKNIFDFAEDYKNFLTASKTERLAVREAVKAAEAKGFKNVETVKTVKSGDKLYEVNKNKNVVLYVIGEKPLTEGLRVLGAHIDSPRLDLKQNPLYESNGFALLDTHYYGGVKKYQYVTIPLALHGVICKKDGTTAYVNIGEDEGDPVVGISDLLIHLSQEQLQKTGDKIIGGEQLDVTVGSIPLEGEEKDAVKANVLKLLNDKYGIEEEDFISAELEAVPAGPARDYGIDRSMIMGYGHDDKVCAYPSLAALLNADNLDKTGVCVLVDKEEIGSVGATGMHSRFFENMTAEVMERMGQYSELKLRRALTASNMLSSDVNAAFDPNYASVSEKKNTSFFGNGMVFMKYTGARGKSGSNDASAEYLAALRKVMDDANVTYQTSELGKVDAGGGGTIAYIMGNYGMNVVDSGVAVQNMHAPFEVISKADLYETYRGYEAFLHM